VQAEDFSGCVHVPKGGTFKRCFVAKRARCGVREHDRGDIPVAVVERTCMEARHEKLALRQRARPVVQSQKWMSTFSVPF